MACVTKTCFLGKNVDMGDSRGLDDRFSPGFLSIQLAYIDLWHSIHRYLGEGNLGHFNSYLYWSYPMAAAEAAYIPIRLVDIGKRDWLERSQPACWSRGNGHCHGIDSNGNQCWRSYWAGPDLAIAAFSCGSGHNDIGNQYNLIHCIFSCHSHGGNL